MPSNSELVAVTVATQLYTELLANDPTFDGSITALNSLIKELSVIIKVDFDPEFVTAEELICGFRACREAVDEGAADPDWWQYV
jgi:hypothetical protein